MDDIAVLKSLLRGLKDDTMSNLIGIGIYSLVIINVLRILGIFNIASWCIGLFKKPNSDDNSNLVVSMYTDIFNNHLLFNSRIESISNDINQLRKDLNLIDSTSVNSIQLNNKIKYIITKINTIESDLNKLKEKIKG